jgi:hypothetical protein
MISMRMAVPVDGVGGILAVIAAARPEGERDSRQACSREISVAKSTRFLIFGTNSAL